MIGSAIELQALFNLKLEEALKLTMNSLLIELQNIIQSEVYSYSLDGAWQNRTNQFLESWKAHQPYFVGMWMAEISQEGYEYLWNSDNGEWSHGNGWEALSMNALNDIINDGLDESNFNFPAIESRPFWTTFQKYVDENLNNIFVEKCIQVGLPIQRAFRM